MNQSDQIEAEEESLMKAHRCEEPRAKQATLASLQPLKARLVESLRAGSGSETSGLVEKLMRLVNVDDEPLLRELVTGYLFDPTKAIGGVSLTGH